MVETENYVITISREFGSMGRTIAKKMSELLNIDYYDREIVEKVSKAMGLPIPMVAEEEEKAKSSIYLTRSFPLGNVTSELQNQIFSVQEDIIRRLADRENCIIVGRCADAVLKDTKNHIHIYIYTSFENKYNNCVNNLKINPKDVAKMIKKVDRARAAYHKRYAGYKPNDLNHIDILIDSSLLGVDGTAEQLVEIVRKKFDLKKRNEEKKAKRLLN